MEGINSSLQVHEGTRSFAGRGEQLVSVSSEDSVRQQDLTGSRWDLGEVLGRSGEVQVEGPHDWEGVEGSIIIIFWSHLVQIAE